MTSRARIAWALLALFIVGLAIIAIGAVVHLKTPMGLEVFKAGLQLVVIGFIGGAVAYLLDRLDSMRRERNQIDEYRLNVLREVISSYNRIKSGRRILRAFGLRSPQGKTLTSEQVAEFVAQMRLLNEAQLSLERIKREVEARPSMFPGKPEISEALRTVEKYIHDVIKDWETHGEAIRAGASGDSFQSLQNLLQFLGSAKCGFGENAARRMDTLEKAIRAQLFTRDPQTRIALA